MYDGPASTVPRELTKATQLNTFAATAKVFRSTTQSNFDIAAGTPVRATFVEQIGKSSSHYVVWRCDVRIGNNPPYAFVCKFKKVPGQANSIALLSRTEVDAMHTCFENAANAARGVENLRVACHMVCTIYRGRDAHYLWFEEFVPHFQTFLFNEEATPLSLRLSLSFSSRIQALQLAMISAGCSPLIDPHGALVAGTLVLGGVKTPEIVAARGQNVNADECVQHILQQPRPPEKPVVRRKVEIYAVQILGQVVGILANVSTKLVGRPETDQPVEITEM